MLSLHSLWTGPSKPLQPLSQILSPNQQQQLPVAVGSLQHGVLPPAAAQLQQGWRPATSPTQVPLVSVVSALFGSQLDGQQSAYGNPAVADRGGCSTSTGSAANSREGQEQQQQQYGFPGGGRAGFLASHAGALLVPIMLQGHHGVVGAMASEMGLPVSNIQSQDIKRAVICSLPYCLLH